MTEAEEREARLAIEPMRPATPPVHFFKGATASLKQIWERRGLLSKLTKREIRARYKDSLLGVVWSLVRPLVSLAIYYLVIGRILGAERGIPDFAIYVFTGLTIWSLVSEAISSTTASIVGNAGIIKKIQLPREIFPLSAIGGALFNFAMQFVILLIGSIAVGGIVLDRRLLFIPLALVLVVVWATALGLLLSAANVYLRDIQYLVEVALMVGMWASPIVYSFDMVAANAPRWIQEVYLANPITLAVVGFQRALWTAGAETLHVPDLTVRMVLSLVFGVVCLGLCQRAFAVLQRDFAQEL